MKALTKTLLACVLVFSAALTAAAADTVVPARSELVAKPGLEAIAKPFENGNPLGVFSGISAKTNASDLVEFYFTGLRVDPEPNVVDLKLRLPADGTNRVSAFNPWSSRQVKDVKQYKSVRVVNCNPVPITVHGLGGQWKTNALPKVAPQ